MLEPVDTKRVFNRGILLGIGLIIVVLIFNAGLSSWNTRQIAEATERVTHTNEVLDAMDAILVTMVDAETGERGYLITGDAQYLEPYNSAIAAIHENIEHLKDLTADNPEQQARLPVLQERVDAKLEELERTIALRKEDPEAARQDVLTHLDKNLMDAVRKQIDVMEREERDLLRIRERQSRSSYFFAVATDI